jgi:hypothetical protein
MKIKLHVCLLLTILVLLIFGCQVDTGFLSREETFGVGKQSADDTDAKKIIRDTGVIRYINLEGGFYGIIGRKGNYDPVNLPRIFQQDGLRVSFTAELLDDMGSIHMWGKLIRIVSMQTIGNKKKLVMDSGVVQQRFIQGNPWIIRATTGTYQVINLPREFQVVGLKVRFVGVIREDIIIIPALWPILEIIEIERVDPEPVIFRLGEEFKLPVKQSALEPEEEILFTFKTVLSDSRCPTGVLCVWQGEAVILVNVKIGSVDYGDFKMSTYGNPSTINVGKYYVKFINLDPYPVYGQSIDPDSYVGYFLIDSALEVEDLE